MLFLVGETLHLEGVECPERGAAAMLSGYCGEGGGGGNASRSRLLLLCEAIFRVLFVVLPRSVCFRRFSRGRVGPLRSLSSRVDVAALVNSPSDWGGWFVDAR